MFKFRANNTRNENSSRQLTSELRVVRPSKVRTRLYAVRYLSTCWPTIVQSLILIAIYSGHLPEPTRGGPSIGLSCVVNIGCNDQILIANDYLAYEVSRQAYFTSTPQIDTIQPQSVHPIVVLTCLNSKRQMEQGLLVCSFICSSFLLLVDYNSIPFP